MRKTTKNNLKILGFADEIERIENHQCAFCGSEKIKPEDFRDDLSRKEYSISALCQQCQDGIFGIGDE
jgi:hypothetical protein